MTYSYVRAVYSDWGSEFEARTTELAQWKGRDVVVITGRDFRGGTIAVNADGVYLDTELSELLFDRMDPKPDMVVILPEQADEG